MPEEIEQADRENAQDAALAQAGAPHGTSEGPAAARVEDNVPNGNELDAREERLSRPRKAMGPTDDVGETVPEEP